MHTLAGDAAVADTTTNVPHPYPDGAAEAWIATHEPGWSAGTLATFAMTLDGAVVGAVGLTIARAHARAELGYWVARTMWRRGIATEAATALLRFGFTELDVHRIHASHFARNPASGRVMVKAGMQVEGTHRAHIRKNGRFEDLVVYAALREEWLPNHSG